MITERTVNDTAILDLPSVLDTDELRAKIQGLIDAQNKRVIINLSNITFIESAGLGALVGIFKLCDENQAAVVFYGIQPYVQKLVEVTKLNRVLKISKTEQEAMNLLSTASA
ncbi:MAG: STAS domain-containing protein [Cyanobacteria bacterium]|nr:STAS domain-containing protein [Cyanobacteriota bacterium]